MLLGVMLLYVGAVLAVNGIWLVGQARAAEHARVAPAGDAAAAVEAHPAFIQPREIAVLNIFTGFVGVATATTLIIDGQINGDLASVRGGGFILLFAFTYLWVAFNSFLNAGGHAFGWYCLFVTFTAIAAAVYTFRDAAGKTAPIWLGIDWIAWAILWFLFFVLLTLERPISRVAGYVAILEGIGTSWVFGFLLLEGTLKL